MKEAKKLEEEHARERDPQKQRNKERKILVDSKNEYVASFPGLL